MVQVISATQTKVLIKHTSSSTGMVSVIIVSFAEVCAMLNAMNANDK
jgi:hypothetical protein